MGGRQGCVSKPAGVAAHRPCLLLTNIARLPHRPALPTRPPLLPAFAIPAEHFVAFLQRFVQHLRTRLAVNQVVSDTPASFLATLQQVRCAALPLANPRLQSLACS